MSQHGIVDEVIDGAADLADAAGDLLGEAAGGRKRGRLLLLLLIAAAVVYFMKKRQHEDHVH